MSAPSEGLAAPAPTPGPRPRRPNVPSLLRLARVRRGLAAALVVLSTGGLVLARTPGEAGSGGGSVSGPEGHVALTGGSNAATFAGPGVHGRFALSHAAVPAGGSERVFAEIDVQAEPSAKRTERAPLAIAVVLDTSGSMEGEKIQEAKRACIKMVRDMRDDDEIVFIRYSSDTELVQPLARVGNVRRSLVERIERLDASGGTNIPPALAQAARALEDAGKGRVRRVVLASDGLDSTRALAEEYARNSAAKGITISSMGIGLDFDEGYMGGVARSGRGNFGFVKDGASLATFLHRELEETASTTVEGLRARIRLPEGMRFVQAFGVDARPLGGNEVEIEVGSLFAGDERRIILELAASLPAGAHADLDGSVTWASVGGDTATARFEGVKVVGTSDPLAVQAGRDGAVLANATSVLASFRQVQAAEAYTRGDQRRAQALIEANVADLTAAATAAPAAAPALRAQMRDYRSDQAAFAAPPSSDTGRAAAKSSAAKNQFNSNRAFGF